MANEITTIQVRQTDVSQWVWRVGYTKSVAARVKINGQDADPVDTFIEVSSSSTSSRESAIIEAKVYRDRYNEKLQFEDLEWETIVNA